MQSKNNKLYNRLKKYIKIRYFMNKIDFIIIYDFYKVRNYV